MPIKLNSTGGGSVTLDTPSTANNYTLLIPATNGSLATTTGTTFADITDSGNLTFTGTGNRIIGDFSNATVASRVSFQTSTANQGTYVSALPNGSSTAAGYLAFNSATDPENSAYAGFVAGTGSATFYSGRVGTGTYLPMIFSTGGSERMRIDTSGNVGIGTNSPIYPLDVVASANTQAIQMRGRASDNLSAFIFNNNTASAGNDVSYIQGLASASAYIAFGTRNTERLRIDSSGNVGIGTSSPAYKLSVSGNFTCTYAQIQNGTTNEYVGLSLTNGYTVAEGVSFIDAQGRNNVTDSHIFFGHQANFGSNIRFATQPAGTNTDRRVERMRIDANGNVLVGITSGTYNIVKKDVNTTALGVFNDATSTPEGINVYFGGVNNSGSAQFFRCNDNAGNRLIIYGTGTIGNSTGSYGAFSDARLKENIVDATNKLSDVLKLRVRNFNLKTEPGFKQIGFVAQELEEVFPALVEDTVDRDHEGNALSSTTKAVKTTVLIPILVKAIQELKAELDELKAKVNA